MLVLSNNLLVLVSTLVGNSQLSENEFQAKSGKKPRKTTFVSEADEKTDEDDPPISDSNKRDDIISDGEASSGEDGSDGESYDESSSSTDGR